MKTNELSGATLDWAVAKCELLGGQDYTLAIDKDIDGTLRVNFGGMYPEWSTDWGHGGPIIERECIGLFNCYGDSEWSASTEGYEYHATTPLVAAMRCYVASKLGDEIEIPADLDY